MTEIAFEPSDSMLEGYRSCSVGNLTNSSSGCSSGECVSSGSAEDLSASSCSVDGVSSSGYWEDEEDAYTASIELSNNCRQFYHNHVKTTEAFKQQTVKHAKRHKQKLATSGIDAAMERLRKEMAELMDQDLSLMEQFLTLNDRIEEMKHNIIYSPSGKSPYASSECFTGSRASLYNSRVFDEEIIDNNVMGHVTSQRDVRNSTSSISTCKLSLADNDAKVTSDGK